MNALRIAALSITVGIVLFVSSGVATASPGTGPATPTWLPEWLWPAYVILWGIGYSLRNGINPLTGYPW